MPIGIVRRRFDLNGESQSIHPMKSLCRQTDDLSHQPHNLSAGFRLYQKRPGGFAQRFIALTDCNRPAKYVTQPEKAREPAVHDEREMRF